MDEGWTRWVLEQYEFNLTSIHNADVRAQAAAAVRRHHHRRPGSARDRRRLRRRTDPPEYRGGIGEIASSTSSSRRDGGTLVTMAMRAIWQSRSCRSRCATEEGADRDQHFAPGAILKLEVDTQHPIGYGVAADTFGFYINSPFSS